jgi:hypothetical protein
MGRNLTTSIVVFILVCLVVDFWPPAPATRLPYEVDDSTFHKVKIIHLSAAEERAVRAELRNLLHPRCIMAYSKAGLRNPLEVMTEEGVVMRPSIDLHEYSAKELGLVSDDTRRAYWEEFSSCRSQAGTVSVRLYGVRLTTDGRPRLILHDSAFQGESFVFGKLSLHDVLVHEFMHLGGQAPTRRWFFEHDLAGFEHYDEIMEACR